VRAQSWRPPWDPPRRSWPEMAASFAPLAEGADLEKVLLRIRLPREDGSLHDAVLDVQGAGGRGVTVRERQPGNDPVRPLTPYRQKVLVAQRFGVPYPYEIVRMMAPEQGGSADLPPGTFVEHDLGPDGALAHVAWPSHGSRHGLSRVRSRRGQLVLRRSDGSSRELRHAGPGAGACRPHPEHPGAGRLARRLTR